MSTMAPNLGTLQPPRFERDSHAQGIGGAGIGGENLPAYRALFEPSPERPPVVMRMVREPYADAVTGADGAQDLAMRIRLLIAREGGTSMLARRCGCSEGTVRSWRDGHSDPSRARCVALARALNISLQWLVTGEGPMHPESNERHDASAEPAPSPATTALPTTSSVSAIDAQRLAATLKLLQSYICMVGGSLNIEQRAEVVAELYGLLCDAGELQEVDRLIAFHNKLGAQLRNGRATLI